MSSCALSLGYGHLKAQKTKCHNKTCAFEQHRSIPAKTKGETVKRSYLLVLHQGLKQLHSKRAANWNRKKWKAWSKKVALQDPASTAAKSHSNLTFSVWTWVQYTWSKKALTWLYIEDITSKHRVPAEPLHPACSMRRPAKRRALTTQRARKTQYDFGGKFHPHLQRLGNTKRARLLLEVDINLWRCDAQFLFFLNRLTAQTIPQGSGGKHSMNITLLSSLQTAKMRMLSDHTRIPPQTMNSPHMLLTRKLCWLTVMTLSNEKTEKPWGQHLFQIGDVWRHRIDGERIAGQLQATSAILRQEPYKLNSCPSVCYVLVLTKEQGKETRALSKNLTKAFDDYLAKEGCLEDPFSKQILRNYQPCVSTAELLNNTKNVSIKKRCLSQLLSNMFILQLRKNIPLTTMTSIVFCFEKSAMERNTSTFILWTWGRMLLKGIFLSNFWNLFMLWPMNAIHAIIFQSTLKRAVAGMLTGAVLSELAHPYRFGLCRFSSLRTRVFQIKKHRNSFLNAIFPN